MPYRIDRTGKDLREEVRFVVAPTSEGRQPRTTGGLWRAENNRPLAGRTTHPLILEKVVRPARGRGGGGVADPPSHRLFEPRLGATTNRTSARSSFWSASIGRVGQERTSVGGPICRNPHVGGASAPNDWGFCGFLKKVDSVNVTLLLILLYVDFLAFSPVRG